MGKHFSVEVRKTCRVCGGPLGYRCRTFCSPDCRYKDYWKARRASETAEEREKRLSYGRKKYSQPSSDKLKCGICGGWYVQVGTHVRQRHGMTAREYREDMDLPVKRGISPDWFREMKATQAIENGTVENLKIGKKFWYKKNDPKAKMKKVGWKGRAGSKGYTPDDLYN